MARDLMNRDFDDFMPMGFFENFGKNFFNSMTSSNSMRTDVVEHDDDYTVSAELPGFQKKNIALDYRDEVLTIRANHSQNNEAKDDDGNVLRSERSYSNVSRQFTIPNIDASKISASYDGGVLKVVLPKKANTDGGTKISIN